MTRARRRLMRLPVPIFAMAILAILLVACRASGGPTPPACCTPTPAYGQAVDTALPTSPGETNPLNTSEAANAGQPADSASEENAAAPASTGTTLPDPMTSPVALELVVEGLRRPVQVTNAGDGSGRLFVVEKAGTIRIVRDGKLLEAPFLDITGRVGSAGSEQGLLGLAFHPDYATTGLFFVNYTDRSGNTVIGRYQVTGDPDLASATGETVVLTIAQPAANHNGGMLAFGPDGYLYIGMGDGGGRPENGQKPDTLLGKMLRLDVTPRAGGQPYTIPPDNPFVADPVVPGEIWLFGLRNPWRWSFDRQTGDLWIGDVGAGSYEEITRVPAGQGGLNLGWAIVEGRHCLRDPNCETEGLTMPLVEYGRDAGCVVVGGYVYRGADFPRLQGSYLFADYCSGRIWALSHDAAEPAVPSELLVADARISAFGEDEQGELYLTDLAGGRLYRLVNLE